MQCPACPDTTLAMTTREGIEIDYCPKCRGIWLDRGELDKVIERSMSSTARAPDMAEAPVDRRSVPQDYRDYDDDDDYRRRQYGKRRRGFLGDLFDFD